MPVCSFCKENYEWPRGLTVIPNDGKVLFFCSGKCRKNHALKRDPKKVNWVKREKKQKTVQKVEESTILVSPKNVASDKGKK